MNKEKIDVFGLQNPHFCQEHFKQQQLICMDPQCKYEPLTCIDCLIEKHKQCKANIQRYSDFIQQQATQIKKKQEEKLQVQAKARQQFETLQDLLVKFNQLIFQQEKNFSVFLNQIDYSEENQQLSILFGQDQKKEIELITKLAKKSNYEEQNFKDQYKKLEQETNEIIKASKDLVQKYHKQENLGQQNIDDGNKYIKVQSYQELKQLNTQISKLRLDLLNEDWNGFQEYICKFARINSIQINACKSQLQSKELHNIISSLQHLQNLEKLNINLVGSYANDQTLSLILNLVNKKKLKEFGILFAFSQILTENFMVQFLNNIENLKNVQKIYLSNQLNEFTQAQEKQLKDLLPSIEFVK